MNISTLRVSIVSTLALVVLILLAPMRLRADTVRTSGSHAIKHSNGAARTSIPEPSSFVLLGTGLVIAALALRSKGIGIR
jgi:PEP-CTERM motif